ncbi:transmembrane protein [Mycobacterium tuberculosis]|nr:transmembrane protein [Mycobacterium tuberculosis]
MSRRQTCLGIAGLLLAIIGVAALVYPIYLDQYDHYGIEVSCGTGLRSDLTQAAQPDNHGLVGQCDTAVLVRRAWAIPAVAIGWLLITGFLVGWVHNSQQKTVQTGQF